MKVKRGAPKPKLHQKPQTIRLLGQSIEIGPGAVPTSTASISSTSTEKMTKGLLKASELGLFDTTARKQ